MDLGLLGVKASSGEASGLRSKILASLNADTAEGGKFIGSHPVTLTLGNINTLLNEDFMVCEKTDGVRVLLYGTEHRGKHRAYLYDRMGDFYELKVEIPTDKDVLLDGELFLEDERVNTYAIFDCLIYDGCAVTAKNFYKRLGCAQLFVKRMCRNGDRSFLCSKEADGWRDEESVKKAKHSEAAPDSGYIEVYVKEMFKSYGFVEIYRNIPNLRHGNDGLIFTPTDKPYYICRRAGILKWKPASLNTVDFKIVRHRGMDGVYGLFCTGSRGREMVFDYYITEDEDVDGKIGEFLYDRDGEYWDLGDFTLKRGGWKLHKIRSDKDTPNNISVVCNILENLDEDLSIERLTSYYKPMRENSKRREQLLSRARVK
jgi:mRNA guanylyltransferase